MSFLVSPDLNFEQPERHGAEARGAIQHGSTAASAFRPCPIEPSWIVDGNPVARSLCLTRSHDGQFSSGLWDCTAGKFHFTYFCDEIVHILEGEVIVEEAGKIHVLRAGDVALFPQGLTALWTVPKYVRKFAIFRSVKRALLTRIVLKFCRTAKRVCGLL
jgi:uncharacterized cupin superfamily protein